MNVITPVFLLLSFISRFPHWKHKLPSSSDFEMTRISHCPFNVQLGLQSNVFLLELSEIHWNLPGRSGNPLEQRKNIKEMGHVYQISLLFSYENQSSERTWWCHYDIIYFGIRNHSYLATQTGQYRRGPMEDVIFWPNYSKINIRQFLFEDFRWWLITSKFHCFQYRTWKIKHSPKPFKIIIIITKHIIFPKQLIWMLLCSNHLSQIEALQKAQRKSLC